MLSSTLKLIVVVNALVSLVTAGGTLVLLLIAPLGLAAVIGCTLLVAGLTFAAGVVADLVIWQRPGSAQRAARTALPGEERTAGRQLLQGATGRLPQRRSR
jgi:hypothetical protein